MASGSSFGQPNVTSSSSFSRMTWAQHLPLSPGSLASFSPARVLGLDRGDPFHNGSCYSCANVPKPTNKNHKTLIDQKFKNLSTVDGDLGRGGKISWTNKMAQ